MVYLPWDRAPHCGTDAGGEILASGYSTARDAVRAWKNDPAHKAIMTDPSYTHFGVGKMGSAWGAIFR